MHPTKLAVWPLPYSRSVYIQEDNYFRRFQTQRRFVKLAKITAIICGVAVLGLRIISGPLTGLNTVSAQAPLSNNNLPAVVIPLIKPTVDDQLQSLISSWAANNSSTQWGVVVQQLNGDNTYAAYQAKQSFYPASLYKLLISQSLLEKPPFSNWNKPMGSGSGQSYATCIDRMIKLSDNDCGVAIGNYVGWSNANNRLKSLGLTGTVLNGGDDQLKTTAGDVSTFIKYFYNSNTYPQAKQALMNSMATQIYRGGIQAGSPGCTVYDKVGNLNGYRHDAAIVVCPNATYSLVIMSKGGSYAQIADLSQQINGYFNQSGF